MIFDAPKIKNVPILIPLQRKSDYTYQKAEERTNLAKDKKEDDGGE